MYRKNFLYKLPSSITMFSNRASFDMLCRLTDELVDEVNRLGQEVERLSKIIEERVSHPIAEEDKHD